jgi:hypothetical protein
MPHLRGCTSISDFFYACMGASGDVMNVFFQGYICLIWQKWTIFYYTFFLMAFTISVA